MAFFWEGDHEQRDWLDTVTQETTVGSAVRYWINGDGPLVICAGAAHNGYCVRCGKSCEWSGVTCPELVPAPDQGGD